jgi:hypothetical protein
LSTADVWQQGESRRALLATSGVIAANISSLIASHFSRRDLVAGSKKR